MSRGFPLKHQKQEGNTPVGDVSVLCICWGTSNISCTEKPQASVQLEHGMWKRSWISCLQRGTGWQSSQHGPTSPTRKSLPENDRFAKSSFFSFPNSGAIFRRRVPPVPNSSLSTSVCVKIDGTDIQYASNHVPPTPRKGLTLALDSLPFLPKATTICPAKCHQARLHHERGRPQRGPNRLRLGLRPGRPRLPGQRPRVAMRLCACAQGKSFSQTMSWWFRLVWGFE